MSFYIVEGGTDPKDVERPPIVIGGSFINERSVDVLQRTAKADLQHGAGEQFTPVDLVSDGEGHLMPLVHGAGDVALTSTFAAHPASQPKLGL